MVGKKRQRENSEGTVQKPKTTVPTVRSSDDPAPKKPKWKNRERVLVFAARRITYQARHLMDDLRSMMPHCRPESKMERKDSLFVVNEICEMRNCQKCVFFEGRRRGDLYMWISRVPHGPAAKFQVENVHTLEELKFSGNCLKGSRPLLSFDANFESEPHYALLKELFIQIFGTPHYHPKSQPFVDHVLTFTVLDSRIWVRNYQLEGEGGGLVEIGPRMTLNPIKIFSGSFSGETLWSNSHFVSPAVIRRQIKQVASMKYMDRVQQRMAREAKEEELAGLGFRMDPTDEVFKGEPGEDDIQEFHAEAKKKGGKRRKRSSSGKQGGWDVQDIA